MFTLWFDANANEEQKQIIPEAARRKKKLKYNTHKGDLQIEITGKQTNLESC